MQVNVRYFATARYLASGRSEKLSLPDEASVTLLKGTILKVHPSLKGLMRAIRFSVNYEIVDDDEILHEGDEVGVLPPVAGG
jgi:molybdopterin converting factor subunit 1